MTTATPQSVTVTRDDIDRQAFDFEQTRDGQGLSMGAIGLYSRALDPTRDSDTSESRAEFAFERDIVDPAIEEVMPQIRDLIADAIERRMPWTWEPE